MTTVKPKVNEPCNIVLVEDEEIIRVHKTSFPTIPIMKWTLGLSQQKTLEAVDRHLLESKHYGQAFFGQVVIVDVAPALISTRRIFVNLCDLHAGQ